jgi:hypothetical protein
VALLYQVRLGDNDAVTKGVPDQRMASNVGETLRFVEQFRGQALQ